VVVPVISLSIARGKVSEWMEGAILAQLKADGVNVDA
jgi:hypothetical protein